MVCIRCQKRPAIIFIQRMENGQMKQEGYCLHCARELHIKPVDDLMKQFGMSEQDLDNMENRMESMMEELGDSNPLSMLMNMSGSGEDADAENMDEDLVPGSNATFPLGFTSSEKHPGDVLAYTGPMGAGKTTFTVGLARGLGSSDWVSSPTFALGQEYRGPVPLCHFDFYRITGVDDLYATGFFDYLDGTRVLAVEWSERIPDALPEGAIHIRFEPLENDCRRITISTPAGDDRLAALPT